MSVAIDGKTGSGNTTDTGAVLTVSNTHLTVGSGSNRALLVFLGFSGPSSPTGITVAWDPGGTNQALTLIASTQAGTGVTSTYTMLYGLINPTSGNKTLTATWASPSSESHLAAVSFTGVDQTSVAVAFPNGVGAVGGSSSSGTTGAITSAVGNMIAALFTQNFAAFASTSGTTNDLDTTASGNIGMASMYDSGAATVTATTAWGGVSGFYNYAGTDILAAGGGGGGAAVPYNPQPQLAPILAQ